jgi:dTDP-4-dehydrorhamnose reductase
MTLNALMNEDFVKEYEKKYTSETSSEKDENEKEFWKTVVQLFQTGKTLKSATDFTSLLKKCPQPHLPPKVYMSKEE